jgi:hypothetical protein
VHSRHALGFSERLKRSDLATPSRDGKLWPNCVNWYRRSALFRSRIAQFGFDGALRSAPNHFKKSNTWVIGDGEHEPALGSYRAMVP